MKLLLLSFALLLTIVSTAQIPSYYSNVNLNATGSTLKSRLASKISSTQSNNLSYTPGIWNALRVADLNTGSNSNVLLLYGYSDSDNDYRTDRTRSKYDNGNNTADWNREHVYPKSLGTPNLGTSGPGADAHHLRACDKSRNASRGSRKFASGSGNSYATSQGDWYPGDEFKGDVARMIMYMYLRYGSRCLPKNVGTGSTVSNDANMVQLFLQWNVDDPVSDFELNRNDVIQGLQGNRNPFIDNPAFATQIWGGPAAEDRFGNGGSTGGGTPPPPTGSTTDITVRITFDNYSSETSWEILNSSNQVVHSGSNYNQSNGTTINVTKTLADGCYTFVFKDSYGDGICCAEGNGSYAVINNSTNNFITSGSSFTFERRKSFCVGSGRFAPAAIEEVEIANKKTLTVALYPNPVQGQLYLKLDNPRTLDYTITNQVGQVVSTGRVVHQQIEVLLLPTGVYFLTLQDGEERVTKRFIKQ